MAKIISSGNVGNAPTKTVTAPTVTKIVTREVQVFRDVVSVDPELAVRTRADGSKELLLQLVHAGLEVLSHSGVVPTLAARPIQRLVLDQCDGTVAAAGLPKVLAEEDGFMCLLSTGSLPITVTPFAGDYLDEVVNPTTYPPLSLVLFVSMFGDSWTSYVISSHNETALQPSGDTTGVTDRAAFEAATGRILLGAGTFYLDATADLASGVSLIGSGVGRTIIRPAAAWAPASGSADDRTIALLTIQGVVGSTVSTTLTELADAGETAIDLTSAAAVTDNMWLVFSGTQGSAGTGDVYLASGGEVVEEITQVASKASNTITLRNLKKTHHRQTGTTVKDVAIVEGVTVSGVSFETTGNHACAVAMRYARDCTIADVAFSGFARAGIDMLGCHAITIGRVHNGGGNNCLAKVSTCQHCTIGDGGWTYDPDGARVHTYGIPRQQIELNAHCVGNVIRPGLLGRGVSGVRVCGGWGNTTRAFTAIDMDTTLLNSRNPTTNGSRCASGYEGAYGQVLGSSENAEFGMGNALEGITCVDHVNHTAAQVEDSGFSVFLHDDQGAVVGPVQLVNKSGVNTMRGISIQDWRGSVASYSGHGVDCGIHTKGNYAAALFGPVSLVAAAGRANVGTAIRFNHATLGPTFAAGIDLYSYGSSILFGSEFTDIDQTIARLRSDEGTWTDLICAYATSAVTVGNTVEMASSGTTVTTRRTCAPTAGATTKPGVCAVGGPYGYGTGYVMVSLLPGKLNTVYLEAATNCGDKLETNASAHAAVNAATAYDTFIGRALTQTAAAGKAFVGP